MRGLLDYAQTSGNDWTTPPGEVLYQEPPSAARGPSSSHEPTDLANLESQMARFEAEHETMIADVRKHFVFSTDSDLNSFFRSHRTLPQLLIQATPHLRRAFGTGTVFNLRAPIDASGSQTLYAVVMWPGPANDARMALADFDENWWFEIVRQASGNLTFTYELV
jgi:hypothetical protein